MSRKRLLYLVFSLLALGIAAWPIVTSASIRTNAIPIQDADGVFEADTSQAPDFSGLAQLPTNYLGTQGADGIKWTQFQPVQGTLANLLRALPEWLIPVHAGDGYLGVSMAYPRQLLGDTVPPQISDVDIEPISGLIEWKTDEFATSEVRYGTEPGNYTGVISATTWITAHQMLLPNVPPGTDSFLIRGADRSGNVGEYYYPGHVIRGTVVDADQVPIAGVVVSAGPGHAAWTDEQGEYALGGVQTGSYILTPYHPAYSFEPASIPITVQGNVGGKNFEGTAKQSSETIYLPYIVRRY
jgi:hypothetical protein